MDGRAGSTLVRYQSWFEQRGNAGSFQEKVTSELNEEGQQSGLSRHGSKGSRKNKGLEVQRGSMAGLRNLKINMVEVSGGREVGRERVRKGGRDVWVQRGQGSAHAGLRLLCQVRINTECSGNN